jgi:hypothetical protein
MIGILRSSSCPDLSASKDLMPMQVAAVLGHKLVQAVVGVAAGHWTEFRGERASFRSAPVWSNNPNSKR